LLGWFAEQTFISDFWDKAEELPGCFMIQREIRKAITGQSFFYNDEESGKAVHVEGIQIADFNSYYLLWDDYHWLKTLPHGKGTLSERRWVLESIKLFEKTHKEILNYIEERNYRKAEMQAKSKHG
jgi:hypothetical protein